MGPLATLPTPLANAKMEKRMGGRRRSSLATMVIILVQSAEKPGARARERVYECECECECVCVTVCGKVTRMIIRRETR